MPGFFIVLRNVKKEEGKMKKKMQQVAICFSALLFIPMYASAAVTWDVVGGQLMGANDVEVMGLFYDVDFIDGRCIDLYGGCDGPDDFTFKNVTEADAASSALLVQVLIDDTGLGLDTHPEYTNGLEDWEKGWILTPYGTGVGGGARSTYVANNTNEALDGIYHVEDFPKTLHTSERDRVVWAVWTPHQAVPEPSRVSMAKLYSVKLSLTGLSNVLYELNLLPDLTLPPDPSMPDVLATSYRQLAKDMQRLEDYVMDVIGSISGELPPPDDIIPTDNSCSPPPDDNIPAALQSIRAQAMDVISRIGATPPPDDQEVANALEKLRRNAQSLVTTIDGFHPPEPGTEIPRIDQ